MNGLASKSPGSCDTPAGLRFLLAVTLFPLLVLSISPGHAEPTKSSRADAFRVQRVEVIDRQGFERPVRAASLMMPAGWRVQSGIVWPRQRECGVAVPLPALQAVSSDKAEQIELTPGENWGFTFQGGAMMQCPVAPWTDTVQYLQGWVQRHRPGARWLGYKPRPDRSVPEQVRAFPMMNSFQRVETGQAMIGYRADGQEWRELLATTVEFSRTVPTDPSLAQAGNLVASARGVLAWRVSRGDPSEKRFDTIWGTLQVDPVWAGKIARMNAAMDRDDAATAGRIGQIQADTAREVMEIRQRGFENRGAMREQGQANAVRGMRETDLWRDPGSGGSVELSQNYRHAWKLKDGSYLLSDDANLDPQRDLGVAGERMKRGR